MNFVAVVALLAVLEYMVLALLTGRARDQYGVAAPATTGHPIFERWYRVQMNTLEQMIAFLPGLFLFASYVSATWAGLFGLLFVAGRVVYARAYLAEPASRTVGFAMGFVATTILVLGGLIGATLAAL